MSEKNNKKLVFVYNATSGILTGIKDYFVKAFKPSSYQCNLCAVTYGAFGMKKEWKNFTKDLDVPVDFMKKDKFSFEFLHIDEFEEKYEVQNAKFPCAYIKDESGLKLIISQDEMNSVKSIDDLKALVIKKVEDFAI